MPSAACRATHAGAATNRLIESGVGDALKVYMAQIEPAIRSSEQPRLRRRHRVAREGPNAVRTPGAGARLRRARPRDPRAPPREAQPDQDGFSHRREIVRLQEILSPLQIPAEVLVVSHEEAAQPERARDAVRDALAEGVVLCESS
jgi:hypothetical protein